MTFSEIFWPIYIIVGLVTFFVLYYAYVNDKIETDIPVPESMIMMVFALAALLWPISFIRWIRFDPGIEIVWDGNSWFERLWAKGKKLFARSEEDSDDET